MIYSGRENFLLIFNPAVSYFDSAALPIVFSTDRIVSRVIELPTKNDKWID